MYLIINSVGNTFWLGVRESGIAETIYWSTAKLDNNLMIWSTSFNLTPVNLSIMV